MEQNMTAKQKPQLTTTTNVKAKYLTKIYVCLGSKIPHEKKRAKRE